LQFAFHNIVSPSKTFIFIQNSLFVLTVFTHVSPPSKEYDIDGMYSDVLLGAVKETVPLVKTLNVRYSLE